MDIENLVRLAQKGEDNAFYELISLNKEKMYVTAYAYVNNKEDALDIVQESVYKAYTSIKKLKEPKFFNTWITRIVINCSIDLVRKNKKLKVSKEEELMINGPYLEELKEEKLISLLQISNDIIQKKDMAESIGIGDKSKSEASYSKTNNQVEGIEEGDIAKTDGKYIYMIRETNDYKKEFIIVEGYPAEDMKILSTIPLGNNVYNEQIQIFEDKIVIMYDTQNNQVDNYVNDDNKVKIDFIGAFQSNVKIYDKKDIKDIKLVREISYEGSLISDRVIDGQLYLVTEKRSYYDYVKKGEAINKTPHIKDSLEGDKDVDLKSLYYCPNVPSESFITIASINLKKPSEKSISKTILASANNMYVSENNLYLSGFSHEGNKTLLFKFQLDKGELNYVAEGEVPGRILNQFSMDEYNDSFRVATTSNKEKYKSEGDENNLYVLGKDMKLLGKLEGLAKGEKIYSARFIKDKAYLVTFKQVDPLFVIDLSDNKNPKVLGELKIPGFSNYLHPYDENTLIGFGQNTVEVKENGREFTRAKGIKLSMFDVKDLSNPKEIYNEIIGGYGTNSELLYNHKALLFSKEKDIIGFPIIDREKGKIFNGAKLYKVSREKGFELIYDITSVDEDIKEKDIYNKQVKRIIFIDNNIYAISNQGIKAMRLDDRKVVGSIKF